LGLPDDICNKLRLSLHSRFTQFGKMMDFVEESKIMLLLFYSL
jgi:hypothetical protein